MNKKKFLLQSYQDSWNDYEYSCKNDSDSKWDWVVVTASNERQAEAYQLQINWRKEEDCLPLNTKFLVISDLEGKRIGSGGATLNVLFQLANEIGIEEIQKKKILLIHSGGDSKRIPQYSACGKIFAPIPRVLANGRQSSIFDELLISMAGVPARIGAGIMVVPSDTEVLFNPLQLDLISCDAAALSMKASVEMGTEHGVFLQGNNMFDGRNRNVYKFLHKQSEETLRKSGAVDDNDNVDIDTGCIWLGKRIVRSLLNLVTQNNVLSKERLYHFVNPKVCLSFYADFVYPLAESSTLEEYYKEVPENSFSEELSECREEIWKELHQYHLSLVKMTPAKYIHFGMTDEMFDLLVNDISDYEYLGWKQRVCTNAVSGSVCNTYVEENVKINERCYIENSILLDNTVIGRGSILSGIKAKGKEIPNDIVLHSIRLKNGKYVCRIYGRTDNPKSSKMGAFLGSSIQKLLNLTNVDVNEVWEEKTASIWNAKLYCESSTEEEALDNALMLYEIIQGKASEEEIDKWKRSVRYSLKESFNLADVAALLEQQKKISSLVCVQKCIDRLKSGEQIRDIVEEMYKNITESGILRIKRHAEESDFPYNIKEFIFLSELSKRKNDFSMSIESTKFEDCAYEIVKNEILKATFEKHPFDKDKAKFVQDEITISLPARVNFCGSPSDAAPYCLEHGGTMLDGALLLKGKKPIVVTVQKLEEDVIILESVDQGSKNLFDKVQDIRNCSNPMDTYALHKAVLLATGVISVDEDGKKLSDICSEIGGGIKISTNVDIPKGSGLGTSSIIAAACVKALNEILNQDSSDDRIYAQVFFAEQLMNTGGGWQDQVGGLHAGLKYFTSKPGLYQKINVEAVKLDSDTMEKLNQRFALIFSGQRRLARNVLREEMNQCIRNDKVAIDSIAKIREYCALMKYHLEKGDITAFAQYITKQFELVKLLDKGASNTCIEYIFQVCDDLIDGKSICGAGGGGFLQVILKEDTTIEELKERINNEFGDCGVEVWDCKLI